MKPQQNPPGNSLTALQHRLAQLPLLPAVVNEVLALDSTADEYRDGIVHLSERDQDFAGHAIRCANSVFNPPTAPVSSLHDAIHQLGPQHTAGLILGLAAAKVFVPCSGANRFLLIHSLQTALFAQMFCSQVPALKIIATQAYVCGLLHDIGRVVQTEVAPVGPCSVGAVPVASPFALTTGEQETLGYDHALLGWNACKMWRLPATIGEVVLHHHDRLTTCADEPPSLVQMIQWADVLSVALFTKPDLPFAQPHELARRLASAYPGIVAGMPPLTEISWHRDVSRVYVKSMQLAHELISFPSST